MMKAISIMLLVSLSMTSVSWAADKAQTKGKIKTKPNIIFIITDDHGYNDLEATDLRDEVDMPNIDILSRNGALMTQGYATAPQCVPSRAGIVTGRYQQRFGLEQNSEGPLSHSQQSIASRLKDLGYTTGHVGKWHLEPNRKSKNWLSENGYKSIKQVPIDVVNAYRPNGFGYDQYAEGTGSSYWSNFDINGKTIANQTLNYRTYGKGAHKKKYRIELQTELAQAFINQHIDEPEPFFLYLAYYGPHSPLDAPKKLTDQVLSVAELEEKGFDNSKRKYKKSSNYKKDYTEAEVRQQGLALLKGIDNGVGEIYQNLKARGELDNTIIFFMSDNGAPTSPRSWDGSMNDPWYGSKGIIFEGGARVPYIVHWPDVIKPQVFDKSVITLDAGATAVAIAGGVPEKDVNLDGVNLVPYLTGKNGLPHQYVYQRYQNTAAIINDKFKFMRHENGEELLFDVSIENPTRFNPIKDHHEGVNIINLHSDKAVELRKQLDLFQQSLPVPHYKEGFIRSLVKFGKRWDMTDAQ